MVREKTRPSKLGGEKFVDTSKLVVHNDDFNTFEFVIRTLVEVCSHDLEQAEQCTFIIHHSGKCVVKVGELTMIEVMHSEMLNRGIAATIER